MVGPAIAGAGFALLALRMWRDNLPTADDRAWMRGMRDVLRNEDEKLPPVGRFEQRMIWRGLGQARRINAKVRWTSPVDICISAQARVVL